MAQHAGRGEVWRKTAKYCGEQCWETIKGKVVVKELKQIQGPQVLFRKGNYESIFKKSKEVNI